MQVSMMESAYGQKIPLIVKHRSVPAFFVVRGVHSVENTAFVLVNAARPLATIVTVRFADELTLQITINLNSFLFPLFFSFTVEHVIGCSFSADRP